MAKPIILAALPLYDEHYSIAITSSGEPEQNTGNIKSKIVQIFRKQMQENFGSLKKEQKKQVRAANDMKMGVNRTKAREYELEHMRFLCDGIWEVLRSKADSKKFYFISQ